MTLTSTQVKQFFNGGTATFAIPFTLVANADVNVVLRRRDWVTGIAYSSGDLINYTGNDIVYECQTNHTSSDFATDLANGKWATTGEAGPWQTKTEGTHYDIVGVNVVMDDALHANEKLLIYRNVGDTQLTDYTATSKFNGLVAEADLDKIYANLQEIQEKFTRVPVLNIEQSDGVTLTIPEPEGDKILGWNAGGTALVNKDLPTATDLAAIEAEINAVEIDVTNLQTAQSSLQSDLNTAEADIADLKLADTNLDSRVDALESENLDRLTGACELVNNQSSAKDLQDELVPTAWASVDADGERTAEFIVSVERKTDTDYRRAKYRLTALYINNAWTLEVDYKVIPDSLADDGVTFSMSNPLATYGIIQYTTDNMSGANYFGKVKWLRESLRSRNAETPNEI